MAHEKVYAVYEDKCKKETVTKQQIANVGENAYEMLQTRRTAMESATTLDEVKSITSSALQTVADAFVALGK